MTIGRQFSDCWSKPRQRCVAKPAIRRLRFGDGAASAPSRLPLIKVRRHTERMSDSLQPAIAAVIARTPEWVRQELASKDPATRARAEEALTAMIASALHEPDEAES